jgi:NADPH2:quinone reductase
MARMHIDLGFKSCLSVESTLLSDKEVSMTQTLGKTMKAVAIDRFGGVETLETQELPIPATGADEVLIHVEAAGVGVWDPFEREGGFAKQFNIKPVFPLVLGSDGAGTVQAVGPQVKRFKNGDRVYGISFLNPKGGFYAQYAVVKETSLALIPGKLTMPQAAAMAVDAVTAFAGLETTLGLRNGESLLIFGASGGIGHLAVQFARRMGARVLAVASGDDGVAFVRGLGADKVVDGYKEDVLAAARQFAPNGLDAVLLTTGGEAAEKSLAALRTGGRVAYPNGVQPVPKERAGIKLKSFDGEYNPPPLDKVNRLIDAGPFEVKVARTFTLDQAADAQRALNDHYLGKLALITK